MHFLLLSVLFSACSVQGAIINVKQNKCSPPESPHKLKPVSLGDLPLHSFLEINEPVLNRSSTALNRTLILDRFFPDEWTILYVVLEKITDRVAIMTVHCPSVSTLTVCSHFMLVQSPSTRNIWIKHVIPGEQYFYGLRHGWRRAFLQLESANAAYVFKVCHFWQMRLVIAPNITHSVHTRLRCAPIDIDGQKRVQECGAVNRIFIQLARRVSTGRISYPDGTVRLFILKLLVTFGCVIGYFLGISALLKRFIK